MKILFERREGLLKEVTIVHYHITLEVGTFECEVHVKGHIFSIVVFSWPLKIIFEFYLCHFSISVLMNFKETYFLLLFILN